jgi:hypothetical protein
MTRAHKLNIAGKTAIIAALMGGSSLSFAQEAAPAVAAPVQQGPEAAPVIAPPAAVRTLPTENDLVNPAAAQQAVAETASKPQTSAPTKAPAKSRVAAPVRAATPVAVAPTAAIAPDAPTDIAPPPVDAIEPAVVSVEDSSVVAPADVPVPTPDAGVSDEDIALFGGIAAALAAIGFGAAFVSRRRRGVVAEDRAAVLNAAPEYVAPTPIRDDPVFQKFAAIPAQERTIQRQPIMTRPDVAITDPLFSTPVMAGPITDPMFAPRGEVEIPITDPLFAKHDRYVGRAPVAPVTKREPELVN